MFCFVDFPGRSYWIVLCNIFAPHCQSMKKEAFIEVCVGSPVGVAYRDGWGVTAGTGISGAVLLPLASLPLLVPTLELACLTKERTLSLLNKTLSLPDTPTTLSHSLDLGFSPLTSPTSVLWPPSKAFAPPTSASVLLLWMEAEWGGGAVTRAVHVWDSSKHQERRRKSKRPGEGY